MSRHEKHLSSYLKSKRSDARTSGVQTGRKAASQSDKKLAGRPPPSNSKLSARNTQRFTNFNSFPDEVLLKIFRHMSPSCWLVCAQVCQHWSALTRESSLWQSVLPYFPKEVRESLTFEETRQENFDWKKEMIRRCINTRNKKILGMCRRLAPYTGLPADTTKALGVASVTWKLCVTDTSGAEHWASADDVTHFASSSSVRWYSLQLPSLTRLTAIQVYAFVPVFFRRNWKPNIQSSTTRSLILKQDLSSPGVKLSRMKAMSDSDMITAHAAPSSSMLVACWSASWKDGGELAFVTVSLHHHNLIKKILKGSHDRSFVPPPHRPCPVLDDLNPNYDLPGYSATVELRNHKTTIWGRQYRQLYQQHVTDDVVCLGELDHVHGSFNKKLSLPWKTELFKNILPDVCFVDVTVLDDQKKPFWCVSSPVKITANKAPDVDYSAEGERLFVEHRDDRGTVRLDFLWIEDEEQTLVTNVEFQILKSFVNT